MNKPKIGIMTFYAAHNNGAALQAFALQQKLNELGADAEFLRYFDQHNEKVVEKHSRLYNLIHNPKMILNILLHYKRVIKLRGVSILTDQAYSKFHIEYFKTSQEPYYKYDDLSEANYRYNGFVTGSDMVWTPIGQNLEAYFLQFADKGKRYSFSPSLTGVNVLTEEQHVLIKKYIEGMDIISCREQEGVSYVQKNTAKKAVQTLDPTLLLTRDEWINELNIEVQKEKDPYILCYMFGGLSRLHKREISKIAKNRNLEIRYIPMDMEQKEQEIDNGYRMGYGPREFVSLFMNASFIITNTYHGLMFSLISQKPFALVHRTKNNKWKSNEGRMSFILQMVGLSKRYIDPEQPIDDNLFILTYDEINTKLRIERERSIQYLANIVDCSKKNAISEVPLLDNVSNLNKKSCTGCGLCVQICPFDAIEMRSDIEGFRYPVVNEQRCKKCGKCTKRCPSITPLECMRPMDAIACLSKDTLLNNSASGGAFVTLSRYFIKQLHGHVFGAVFDKKFKCLHTEATSMNEIPAMQSSKYIQSDIEHVYIRVKELLSMDKYVLFTGTPCQVAALLSFVGTAQEKLLTVSLICHGVPSPKYWDTYITQQYKGKLSSYSFRNRKAKEEGRTSYELNTVVDGLNIRESCFSDIYYSTFLKGLSFRESCYYCQYARRERIGDLTLGDFDSEKYYPAFYPKSAKSVIIVNTEKGQKIINRIKHSFETIHIDYELEVRHNTQLRIPSIRPSKRDIFYYDLNNKDWVSFVKNYSKYNNG